MSWIDGQSNCPAGHWTLVFAFLGPRDFGPLGLKVLGFGVQGLGFRGLGL